MAEQIYIAIIKLLQLETKKDYPKIEFLVDLVLQEVVIYCNLKDTSEIPLALKPILIAIIIDFIEANENPSLKSISRGDYAISYNTGTSDMQNFIQSYSKYFNKYRRLDWN